MLPIFTRYLPVLALFVFASGFIQAKTFTVVAYNVENLFDADGVSLYDDYKPETYGSTELENKLAAIIRSLRLIGGPTGPDVVLLQEIEVDRTPNSSPSASELLLDALKKNGLGPYEFAQGYDPDDIPSKWPAVQCMTLSKFPISSQRLHPIRMARPILETTISVGGTPFILFNNHWKSGASSQEMETHRIQNAETLRKRIDEIIRKDPFADFLVGGDLNSHYNQSAVYASDMPKTGINDVLLAGPTEPDRRAIAPKLYNLWHELPVEQRGSDAWRGKWGTLMHIIIPQGLYDGKGIRYIADSFEVCQKEGVNAISGSGLPFKWSNELNGFGMSDHFPVIARFSPSGLPPKKGKNYAEIETEARSVDYARAAKIAPRWSPKSLDPQNYGVTFRFRGTISRNSPLSMLAEGHQLGLYSFNPEIRKKLFSLRKGDSISGVGHLSRYRGQWQFLIEEEDWIK